MDQFHPCTLRQLPECDQHAAAMCAVDLNPVNRPASHASIEPSRIAVLTTKYWGAGGVELGVAFMERISTSLMNRILSHMNAWGAMANVHFFPTGNDPAVRIGFGPGGYWSYLGTDILQIPKNQPTMNLEGFTERTPEREFARVVRHETGHTLGFPHEHMRRDLVARLDPAKTIAYFGRTQGWSEAEVRAQVLTPLEERSLLSPTPVDATSIMCYQLPGSITRDGQPIVGGTDINATDAAYAAKIYPQADKPDPPSPPAPPPANRKRIVITGENLTIAQEPTSQSGA